MPLTVSTSSTGSDGSFKPRLPRRSSSWDEVIVYDPFEQSLEVISESTLDRSKFEEISLPAWRNRISLCIDTKPTSSAPPPALINSASTNSASTTSIEGSDDVSPKHRLSIAKNEQDRAGKDILATLNLNRLPARVNIKRRLVPSKRLKCLLVGHLPTEVRTTVSQT